MCDIRHFEIVVKPIQGVRCLIARFAVLAFISLAFLLQLFDGAVAVVKEDGYLFIEVCRLPTYNIDTKERGIGNGYKPFARCIGICIMH